MSRGTKRQRFNPGTPTIYSDPPGVNAVMKQGQTTPHHSTLKSGNTIRVSNSTGGSMAQVTASDNGAAEFDVAPTALTTAPYNLVLTWADLSGLAKGVYSRVITITAAGAGGSPKGIPVVITVI